LRHLIGLGQPSELVAQVLGQRAVDDGLGQIFAHDVISELLHRLGDVTLAAILAQVLRHLPVDGDEEISRQPARRPALPCAGLCLDSRVNVECIEQAAQRCAEPMVEIVQRLVELIPECAMVASEPCPALPAAGVLTVSVGAGGAADGALEALARAEQPGATNGSENAAHYCADSRTDRA